MTSQKENQLLERMIRMVEEEIKTKPKRWMYLSFASEEGFRGGIYIQGHGLASALALVHSLGQSPGGQVIGVDIPEDVKLPAPEFCNRLLSKAELESINSDMATLGELEAEGKSYEDPDGAQ